LGRTANSPGNPGGGFMKKHDRPLVAGLVA
jgi:hypothetical protein